MSETTIQALEKLVDEAIKSEMPFYRRTFQLTNKIIKAIKPHIEKALSEKDKEIEELDERVFEQKEYIKRLETIVNTLTSKLNEQRF